MRRILQGRRPSACSTPAKPASRSTANEVGPCSARPAIASVSSSTVTSKPMALSSSQGRCRSCAAQPEPCRREPEQRAVVEDVAFVVAPGGVVDPAGFQLCHVAQGDAVEEGLGVRALDAVFRHRRDVEQCRLAADGEIFELLVPQRMRGLIAGPIVPVIGPGQRIDARLERRGQPQRAEMRLRCGAGVDGAMASCC